MLAIANQTLHTSSAAMQTAMQTHSRAFRKQIISADSKTTVKRQVQMTNYICIGHSVRL